ncbi:hypothetical protein V6N12_050705 [Hibiscus sabdariffa]|uniref:RNase H type-1 domain-containing protein n=1 Tax=Hibiscus sabdariffa TaxID=183260 RepID=A0ABR2GE86_9ROSI
MGLEDWLLHNLGSNSLFRGTSIPWENFILLPPMLYHLQGSLCFSTMYRFNGNLHPTNGSQLIAMAHLTVIALMGILDGLRVAWNYGLEQIQCQIDCVEAFKLISSEDSHNSSIRLVRKITSMTSKAWVVDFIHIRREANYVADSIVKMPPNLDGSTSLLQTAPMHIANLLHCDLYGPPYSRI